MEAIVVGKFRIPSSEREMRSTFSPTSFDESNVHSAVWSSISSRILREKQLFFRRSFLECLILLVSFLVQPKLSGFSGPRYWLTRKYFRRFCVNCMIVELTKRNMDCNMFGKGSM